MLLEHILLFNTGIHYSLKWKSISRRASSGSGSAFYFLKAVNELELLSEDRKYLRLNYSDLKAGLEIGLTFIDTSEGRYQIR